MGATTAQPEALRSEPRPEPEKQKPSVPPGRVDKETPKPLFDQTPKAKTTDPVTKRPGTPPAKGVVKDKAAAPEAPVTAEERELAKGLALPPKMDSWAREYALQMRRVLKSGCAAAGVLPHDQASQVIAEKIMPHWDRFNERFKTNFGMDQTSEFACVLGASSPERMARELRRVQGIEEPSQSAQVEAKPEQNRGLALADPKLEERRVEPIEKGAPEQNLAHGDPDPLKADKAKTEEPDPGEGGKQRVLAEQRKTEEEHERQVAEQRRSAEEQERQATEQRKIQEEQERQALEQRKIDEAQQRLAEEQRKIADEQDRQAAEQRKVEEQKMDDERVAEQQRKAAEEARLKVGLTLPATLNQPDLQYILQMRRVMESTCAAAKIIAPKDAENLIGTRIMPYFQRFAVNLKDTFGLERTDAFVCMLAKGPANISLDFLNQPGYQRSQPPQIADQYLY